MAFYIGLVKRNIQLYRYIAKIEINDSEMCLSRDTKSAQTKYSENYATNKSISLPITACVVAIRELVYFDEKNRKMFSREIKKKFEE